MIPKHIGKIVLSGSTELRFEITSYKGRTYLNVRQYVDSARYTGYTKKGIAFSQSLAVKILEALQKYQQDFSTDTENVILRLSKNNTTDVIVQIIPPDDKYDFTQLDVREYVESDTYSGWTKKGFRVKLDRIEEVANLLDQSVKSFDSDLPLFSDDSDEMEKPAQKSYSKDGKHLIREILQCEIPTFPEDFFPEDKQFNKNGGVTLVLPPEPIYLGAMCGTKQEIVSDAGFEYLATNPVEAKFVFYAHQNNHKKIIIPDNPFVTFQVVKRYEVFIRDLKKKVVHLLTRRIKDKTSAFKLAEKYFKDAKLPWIEEEK